MGKAGLVAVALAGALCSAASAQEAGRYQMERNDSGGYVRLDTLTGEMAFCTEQSGRIACGEMSGEGEALADKVARLEARIEALERKLGEGGEQVSGLPTDEITPSGEVTESPTAQPTQTPTQAPAATTAPAQAPRQPPTEVAPPPTSQPAASP